jgi:hypothetical protein
MAPGVTPRQLLGIALVSCAVAATLGATPLASWVDGSIAGGTVVQQAADDWLALTQRAGLDRPYTALRQAMRGAEAAD